MASGPRAKRYERARLWLHVSEIVLVVGALGVVYLAGGSRALAQFARAAGGNEWGAVAIYVAILFAGGALLTWPLSWWSGFWLEHRFNLSNQSFAAWLWDEARAFALSLVFMTIAAEAVYFLLRAAGAWWWLWAAAFMMVFSLLLGFILPVVILPIFYKLEPLADESLAARLKAMAERAGARVVGVFRVGLGEKTKKANAAFAGFGRTRRILLGDTLLNNFSAPEIEVVLAHEMAHYHYRDLWTGMAFSAVSTTAGLWLSDLWLRCAVGGDLANIEHMPLLAVGLVLFFFFTAPATRAWTRRAEYRADWFALEMTRDPDAFESAMRRLAGQNLADMEPHAVVEFLFHSHPSLSKRIAKAALWRQGVRS